MSQSWENLWTDGRTDRETLFHGILQADARGQTKHAEAEKKLTDLTNIVAQISEKGYDFMLGIMYFTGDHDYQIFLVFASMLSSLTLDSNKKNTDWISTWISPKNIKSFDANLELTMSYLAMFNLAE